MPVKGIRGLSTSLLGDKHVAAIGQRHEQCQLLTSSGQMLSQALHNAKH